MANNINPDLISFAPIDLGNHRHEIVEFRKDSFVVSFGDAEKLIGEDKKGIVRYLETLTQRSQSLPGSCVSVFHGEELIGQIELRFSRLDSNAGYVNLFYLKPSYRGKRGGKYLDKYAEDFFCKHGKYWALLNVSATNESAIRFYQKNNWVALESFEVDGQQIIRMKKDYEHEDDPL